jgi:16S rRNA (cytidine1402-2'-O)-methyltransferase
MNNSVAPAADPGTLYLVGTPIGNLSDMTERALRILESVDLIAAEDTRVSSLLLSKYGIKKPMESYHEHNRQAKGRKIIELLKNKLSVGLVSDAGMPCISDPGEDLVRLCVENEVPVVVIPGVNAGLTALSGSGLSTERFAFEGFIPSEGRQRRERMMELPGEKRTMVLYEAPHRLQKTLLDLCDLGLGGRRITIARELTKRYEEWLRLTVEKAFDFFSGQPPRGEFVLILEGLLEYNRRCPADPEQIEQDLRRKMRQLIEQGMSVSQAARELSERENLKKNELYKIGLTLQTPDD